MKTVILASATLFTIGGSTWSAEKHSISLEQICAYDMPGTRDVQDLAKQDQQSGRSLFAGISEAMVQRIVDARRTGRPRSGFIVAGSDETALRAAHAIFVKGDATRAVFTPREEVSLVFYSEPAVGNKVHIAGIQVDDRTVTIKYRLTHYSERNLTAAFALVPLGRLLTGTYEVKFELVPSKKDAEAASIKWIDQYLCKPFSFRVTEK